MRRLSIQALSVFFYVPADLFGEAHFSVSCSVIRNLRYSLAFGIEFLGNPLGNAITPSLEKDDSSSVKPSK